MFSIFSSRRISSFPSAPMHDNPVNTPLLNASELVDGIEIYSAYDTVGKQNIFKLDVKLKFSLTYRRKVRFS